MASLIIRGVVSARRNAKFSPVRLRKSIRRGHLFVCRNASAEATRSGLLGAATRVWDKLLSPFKQVEKRQLQHEIDMHRLFLLTSYNRLGASGGEEAAMEIQSIAENTSFSTQQSEVQNNVHRQIVAIADVLDSILLKTSRKSDVQPIQRPSGLSFAIGGVHSETRVEIPETHSLTRADVSELLRERLGFTLECRKSGIEHVESGEGLFLCGKAKPGTVVSIYPGVIYAPSQYRYIPGYPRVDTDNPYLISRYDGLILDGKPWGRGGDTRDWWDGTNEGDESLLQTFTNPKDVKTTVDGVDIRQTVWEKIAGVQKRDIPIRNAVLDRRNPLAFGHFANHPPKNIQPNVMICAYSVSATDEFIRPYIPNLVLGTEEEQMERQGLLWIKEGKESENPECKRRSSEIRTLVLIATRTLEDEELLLNYRLSSHIRRPSWFYSVNEEEDERRWE